MATKSVLHFDYCVSSVLGMDYYTPVGTICYDPTVHACANMPDIENIKRQITLYAGVAYCGMYEELSLFIPVNLNKQNLFMMEVTIIELE